MCPFSMSTLYSTFQSTMNTFFCVPYTLCINQRRQHISVHNRTFIASSNKTLNAHGKNLLKNYTDGRPRSSKI